MGFTVRLCNGFVLSYSVTQSREKFTECAWPCYTHDEEKEMDPKEWKAVLMLTTTDPKRLKKRSNMTAVMVHLIVLWWCWCWCWWKKREMGVKWGPRWRNS